MHQRTSRPADALTIAGVTIVAHILANVLHEGAGHGGACLIAGARPLVVSTVHMECSAENRLVEAGGTLVNIAAGLLFLALGRMTHQDRPILKYFLWLSTTMNLFAAAGYFLFSGIGGFGDWAAFIEGFQPQWAWRTGMAIFGAAAYLLVVGLSLLELRPFIGSDPEGRMRRAARLTKLPYFTSGILACLAGALNPVGWKLIVLSAAAASFGGSSGLVWMTQWLRSPRFAPRAEGEGLPIERSWPWIAAACLLAAVYVAVLGPGLRFGVAQRGLARGTAEGQTGR